MPCDIGQPSSWRGPVNEGNDVVERFQKLKQLEKKAREALESYKRQAGSSGIQNEPSQGHLLANNELNDWAYKDETDVSLFAQQVHEPALTFPFELDLFQKRAIIQVEKSNDVFVAAHTSAGKTVVAEYAIARAKTRKHKVIYTSPVKTLSNQKFEDFNRKFDSVGLITGDERKNVDAQCLIMTTEILRSMIYNDDKRLLDVATVIFDEMQYLNDRERGVVWEESIILLPSHIRMVMLSATVPNALEFSSWVGKTKGRRVVVISTLTRPVPLQHSILEFGVNGMQTRILLEAGGQFRNPGLSAVTKDDQDSFEGLDKLAKHLDDANQTPAIVFYFSRAKCQTAVDLTGVDLLSPNQKQAVDDLLQNQVAGLSDNDRKKIEVRKLRPGFLRGVAFHHAGMLPFVKKVVEELFGEGLIKVLYATETFAVGVNMPARTVVFASLEKFTGSAHRLLGTGEYRQMSGRAGRRGKDKTGYVYIFWNTLPDPPTDEELRNLITGQPKPLKSRFKLSNAMILKGLLRKDIDITDVIAKSFHEIGTFPRAQYLSLLVQQIENNISESPASDQSSTKSAIRIVGKYLEEIESLRDLQGKVRARQRKIILEKHVYPGRIVVAEIADGQLAIATVYSVVSNGKPVREHTLVWLAVVSGRAASSVNGFGSSVLLLPERQEGSDSQHAENEKEVFEKTTKGLVVKLKLVEVAKILYICESREQISKDREKNQQLASKSLFFDKRSTRALRSTLKLCATFLEQFVSEWRKLPDAETNYRYRLFPDHVRLNEDHHTMKRLVTKCRKFFNDSKIVERLEETLGEHIFENVFLLLLKERINESIIDNLKLCLDTASRPAHLSYYECRMQVLSWLGFTKVVRDDADAGENVIEVTAKGRAACKVDTTDAALSPKLWQKAC